MEQAWPAWVDENLQRGCNPQQIVDILLKNHFTFPVIREMMGNKFPAEALSRPAAIDHKALCEIPLLSLGKKSSVHYVPNPKVQLYTVYNFLTNKDCNTLIEVINRSLRPSTVTVYREGFRTSYTSDLTKLDHPIVETIDKKIAAALSIHLSYSEGIQAQKYTVGQEFKAHTDYFEPNTEEYKKFAVPMGNRTWTFMVYLNDTPKGGGTHFVNIDKIFYPKKGMAIAWNNLHADGTPNPYTMHHGMPVEEGEKYIITKWFRENGKGKMFYDDENDA